MQGFNDINIVANQQLITLSGQLSGPGSLQYLGGGDWSSQLAITGNNASWSGGVNLSALASLTIGNSSALGSGVFDFQEGACKTTATAGRPVTTFPTPLKSTPTRPRI